MSLKFVIEGVERISNNIWKATLNPSDARALGSYSNSYGSYTVVLLSGSSTNFDVHSKTLSFDSKAAKLLNVGSTDQAFLLSDPHQGVTMPQAYTQLKDDQPKNTENYGDKKFLSDLTEELQALGETLLAAVRRQFRGELRYHPRSGKFVESPDNFWTVRIQPRDRSLRITVRGIPSSFFKTSTIVLKADMGSYSAFKVSDEKQIEEAIAVIRMASQK